MTLPIQTLIDTHEALSDWKFTAQEANQVIASVWGSVISAIILTTMTGMFAMEVSGGSSNPGLGSAMKESLYIVSKPPKKPFLYHHSTYSGLKRIAEEWAIRASPGKHVVSLTTDPGRFLSPIPMLAAVTVDGVVKMPFTAELQEVTIPALYRTHKQELADKAREIGYKVFTKEELPLEYKYIMRFVVHSDMFIDENEYVVIADYVNVPTNSTIYVDPKKLKRFKAGLRRFSMEDIRSLEELAVETEKDLYGNLQGFLYRRNTKRR